MSNSFTITPEVDKAQEFIEIANDFSNPLDIVREAISNAYDANASKIWLIFTTIEEVGETIFKITLRDNGEGMNRDGLQSFFDLGNSLSRNDPKKIGEKGHGTKVYFNCKKIEVITIKDGTKLHATMDKPMEKLYKRAMPEITVNEKLTTKNDERSGTEINIYGYNNNRRDRFSHARLSDHILWFTAHATIEAQFDENIPKNSVVYLQGLDRDQEEEISQGHHFPEENSNIEKLLNNHKSQAPNLYCKRIKKTGHLDKFPDIEYQAIFSIEGRKVKYDSNNMIRRQRYEAPDGAYTIQERYGLWLCKDYIPIQRKNEWITSKGQEYTKFHAFFNCQDLKLTANRGSIENTKPEILDDIQNTVQKLYNQIISSDAWAEMEWLEEEATSSLTEEKEKKNFEWRKKKINRANIALYENTVLVEPERESGVFGLFLILATKKPDLFPFQILDYDTHEGIDVIAKGDKTTPISSAKLYYVEFKRHLSTELNHSFANLHCIVCWDTEAKHDEKVEDLRGEKRKMEIIPPAKQGDYTRYYLTHDRKAHRIEVFVLKTYLKEKLNLNFRSRTKADIY